MSATDELRGVVTDTITSPDSFLVAKVFFVVAERLDELADRLDALEARLAPVEPPDLKALFPALRDERGIEREDALRRLRDAAPSYSLRPPLGRTGDELPPQGSVAKE